MSDKPYHHGDLRNSLIETGIKIVNKSGKTQFSLRKVAAECNVSYAAPYSHFKNKEELLSAMQEHVTARLTETIERRIAEYPDKDDQHLLLLIGKDYTSFFIAHPQYFQFLLSSPFIKINLSLADENSGNFPPFELFRESAVRIMKKLGVPNDKLLDQIISMWATVHGLAAIATMEHVSYAYDWEEKIESIISNEIYKKGDT